MAEPIKNPTGWRPPSGEGSVQLIGNKPIVDSVSFLPIVDNALQLPILTTPTTTLPKNPTTWEQTG